MASRRPSWRHEALNVYEVREVKGDIRDPSLDCLNVSRSRSIIGGQGEHQHVIHNNCQQHHCTNAVSRSGKSKILLTAASERAPGFLCFFSSTSQVRSTTGTPR